MPSCNCTTRCLSLCFAINTSADGLKHLMMVEEMCLLTSFPALMELAGLEAACLRGRIHIFMRRVRAFKTLIKLLLDVNILVMMTEKGLSGIMAALLMDVVTG